MGRILEHHGAAVLRRRRTGIGVDAPDKRKSFDLYREHLAGVRLVTFDEIFEQLRTLRTFLGSGVAE